MGIGDFFFDMVAAGPLSLIAGYDKRTGTFNNDDTRQQAWSGLGMNVLGIALGMHPEILAMSAAAGAAGVDNWATRLPMESQVEYYSSLAGLVGIDPKAEDPFASWKKDPARTGTTTVLNIASLFAPGANVEDVAKAAFPGSRIGRVGLRLAAGAADLVTPGGSFAVKGAGEITNRAMEAGLRSEQASVDMSRAAPAIGDSMVPRVGDVTWSRFGVPDATNDLRPNLPHIGTPELPDSDARYPWFRGQDGSGGPELPDPGSSGYSDATGARSDLPARAAGEDRLAPDGTTNRYPGTAPETSPEPGARRGASEPVHAPDEPHPAETGPTGETPRRSLDEDGTGSHGTGIDDDHPSPGRRNAARHGAEPHEGDEFARSGLADAGMGPGGPDEHGRISHPESPEHGDQARTGNNPGHTGQGGHDPHGGDSRGDDSHGGTTHPDSTHGDSTHPDATRGNMTRPDATHQDTLHQDTLHPDTAHGDADRLDPNESPESSGRKDSQAQSTGPRQQNLPAWDTTTDWPDRPQVTRSGERFELVHDGGQRVTGEGGGRVTISDASTSITGSHEGLQMHHSSGDIVVDSGGRLTNAPEEATVIRDSDGAWSLDTGGSDPLRAHCDTSGMVTVEHGDTTVHHLNGSTVSDAGDGLFTKVNSDGVVHITQVDSVGNSTTLFEDGSTLHHYPDGTPEIFGDPALQGPNREFRGTVDPSEGWSDSGLTHNGKLDDPSQVPEPLQELADKGIVSIDENGVVRTNEKVTEDFKLPETAESYRESSIQSDCMNDLTQDIREKNMQARENDPNWGNKDVRKYKGEANHRLAEDLTANHGMTTQDAQQAAKDMTRGHDVLHGPDRVIGGHPNNFTGYESSASTHINRSMGSHWARDKVVNNFNSRMTKSMKGIPRDYYGDVRVNTEFLVNGKTSNFTGLP